MYTVVYSVTEVGVDTAENEPSNQLQTTFEFPTPERNEALAFKRAVVAAGGKQFAAAAAAEGVEAHTSTVRSYVVSNATNSNFFFELLLTFF